jgi:acetyltransferase-like isoleucine patch superfamily enzyme
MRPEDRDGIEASRLSRPGPVGPSLVHQTSPPDRRVRAERGVGDARLTATASGGGAGKKAHSLGVTRPWRYWSQAVPTAAWSSICALGDGYAMQELLASLPSWRLGLWSRREFLQRRLRSCGSHLVVSQGVFFEFPERIDLGDRVFVNRGTLITAHTDIHIGDDVLIGPYVVINSGDHNYADPTQPIASQGHTAGPITIGSDVWLGAHCVILRDVKVGDGAVVAAGAVVIDDVPPRTLVAGIPAVPKKLRGAGAGPAGGGEEVRGPGASRGDRW